VTGASGRLSELMAVWHMGRESLLDFAIRHELGHAFCNDANEMNANRVARQLEQKKPISCKTKAGANRQQLNLQPRESEIVDAVSQSKKSIRGEPVESCKLRYFNSFEFFDHTTGSLLRDGHESAARITPVIT
jgi:hypothetical protein